MANDTTGDQVHHPKNDPRLERYLTTLEGALRPLPVSDRAEVITEIKSHVYSALERDPSTSLDTILTSLGEPETVANRYLLERGLRPAKTSVHPIVKWLVIGFLGTFAMTLIFSAFAISRLTSFVKWDGGNRIEVPGGVIDLSDDGQTHHQFEGKQDMTAATGLQIKIASGKFEFNTANTSLFSWSCHSHGQEPPTPKMADGILNFDLSLLKGAKCELTIPKNLHVQVEADNGKLNFVAPEYDLVANLENGKILFSPAHGIGYAFDTSVSAGKTDKFESAATPAHQIKIHVQNGVIRNEE